MRNCTERQAQHMSRYLSENINGKLVISLRNISHTMRSLYEGRGSQRRVLIVLREAGTITQRELTERLAIKSGSASEVLSKLERAELVTRTPSQEDHRTSDISLTEKGVQQAESAIIQRLRRHEEMFSVLSDDEKKQLLSLLEKINADWEQRYHGDRTHRRCGLDRNR